MKVTDEENKRMLKALEGKKQFKHCLSCGRMFFKGTICPWCKGGWIYGFIDEHNRVTFEDEGENGETKAKDGFIEIVEKDLENLYRRKNDKRKNN